MFLRARNLIGPTPKIRAAFIVLALGSASIVSASSAGAVGHASRSVSHVQRPSIQSDVAQFTDPNPTKYDNFGWCIAPSTDGQLAVVTDQPLDPSTAGAAYVFSKASGTWSLVATLAQIGSFPQVQEFGDSCAISSDGSTIVIGSISNGPDDETAFLYTEPIGGWSGVTQPATTLADNSFPYAGGNTAVSISADGSTAVVGVAYAGWVYTMPAGGWDTSPSTAATVQLLPASADGYLDQVGKSVAISPDGSTIALFAVKPPADPSHPVATDYGRLLIFDMPGGGWSADPSTVNEDSFIDGSLLTTRAPFGQYLTPSFTADGSMLAIGDPTHCVVSCNTNQQQSNGAAYVFERSGDAWVDAANLAGSDELEDSGGAGSFGSSLDIAPDGTSLIVGAPYFSSGGVALSGSVYTFANAAGSWTQTDELLPTVPAPGLTFGLSVSLTNGGADAFIGAPAYYAQLLCIDGCTAVVRNALADARVASRARHAAAGRAYADLFKGFPIVTRLSAKSVAPGGRLTIYGSRLTTSQVRFDGKSAEVSHRSYGSITIVVPYSAFSGFLSINSSSSPISAGHAIVVFGPKVVSMSSRSGRPGSTVTIYGSFLKGVTKVGFGKVVARFTHNSTTSLVVVVPNGAKSGVITLTAPSGSATTAKFTVT